jgi:TetR/AcrR family transcriptional regulator, regulator of cefoperazone and chloramphenicol sensitivity
VRGAKDAADSLADPDTRERLLGEGARLFAARGFARVTVRDICRAADANVAAINYHFGGKKGLYDAVVQSAIDRMQATTEAIIAAGRGQAPKQQMTAYITIFLKVVTAAGRDNWIHQLMVREITEPTPALDRVVREVLEPRTKYLAGVVASLLGCRVDDPRVGRSVMSVQLQTLAAIDQRPPMHRVPATPAAVDELADHIARFSLGGIAAINETPRLGSATRRGTRRAPRGPLRRRPSRR